MMQTGNRTIKVRKEDLIQKIKDNKKAHAVDFKKAVVAFREEALKQLGELTEKVNDGELEIKLKLITPVDNSENYDKILEMFKWEIADEVDLTQEEFKEYVQDVTIISEHARMSNMAYLH